jgi:phosphodiesterase/alkaline phosphatase D-like protein/prolyl-tRNA editing enzyme YbaK/EbsC (Cys-tRNA(Pro) deacylase)
MTLTAGKSYCAALQATNATATATASQVSFQAGEPRVFTFQGIPTGTATATVTGTVNPVGQATEYRVVYDLSTSTWCTTAGASGSPSNMTTPQSLAATDLQEHAVAVHLMGLAVGKGYCAALQATNTTGTTTAPAVDFTPGQTFVSDFGTTITGAKTATVQGQIGPGSQKTEYEAVYDVASGEWCKSLGAEGSPAGVTVPQTLGFTDTTGHFVAVHVTGLTAGTTYCAALRAVNSSTVTGFVSSFTAAAPGVNGYGARITGATTATLLGAIQPGGQETKYRAVYGLSSTEWCTSGGTKNSPTTEEPAQVLGFTDSALHLVSVHITGLTAGQTYCAALRATNGTTTVTSFQSVIAPSNTFSVFPFEGRPTSATTAFVSASVNPGGHPTKYTILSHLTTSECCESGGATAKPSSTGEQSLGFTDKEAHTVLVNLSGLAAGSQYCANVVAKNGSGSAQGAFVVYFTVGVPVTELENVFGTGAATASVTAAINPSGQEIKYKVLYDLATSEWCENEGASGTPAKATPIQVLAYTDASLHRVAVHLGGLTPGKRYCVALQATNGSGTATSLTEEFTLGEPSVSIEGAQAISATAATVTGLVGPSGQETKYKFLYDLATSEFCESGGLAGKPSATTAQPLEFADNEQHGVSVELSGLTAGKRYCVAVQATNATATVTSATIKLAAGLPSVATGSGSPTSATAATVSGSVHPSGQETKYKVLYDIATSEWCESAGATSEPAKSTGEHTLAADTTVHPVTPEIPGLTSGQPYCAAIEATNGAGTASSTSVARFTVGEPALFVYEARATGSTTAMVGGYASAGGLATTYRAFYDVASSEWCESSGVSGEPSGKTAVTPLEPTDTVQHPVSVALMGLAAGTTYCATIQATNATATRSGALLRFTAGAPLVFDDFAVQALTSTSAVASGSVNPSGQETKYKAVYDLASSEWCESSGSSGKPANATGSLTVSVTDTSYHAVSATMKALTPGAKYCEAIEATNAGGTTTGGTIEFTVGEPVAFTNGVQPTSSTAATVIGDVNPAGQETKYKILYGLTSSEWCESEGAAGTPTSTLPTTLGVSDTSFHEVTPSVSALTTGKRYCAAIQATNATGMSTGNQITFTAGAPAIIAVEATLTGPTSAMIAGSIDPAGQEAKYKVLYDLSTSEWCETEGETGTPANATTAKALAAGSAFAEVTVPLMSLATGKEYCATIQATSGALTATGEVTYFTPVPGPPTPIVVTGAATSITTSGATLNATVNPRGSATTCKFEYGTTTAYGLSVPCASGPGAGSIPVSVSASVTGLSPNATYHFRISATNEAGTSTGEDETVKTAALVAPTVVTQAASAVTTTAATLNATVNPNGSNVTDCKFEYGTSESYGSVAECATPPGNGSSPVPVSAALTGLSPNTTYHFRVSATNGIGTTKGSDETLKTAPLTPPTVLTEGATAVTQTTAALNATVNPNGSKVTDCKFEYGTSESYGSVAECATPPGGGSSPVSVSAALAGLNPNTTYHFRISATNGGGTSKGTDVTLKTAELIAPTVVSGTATSVTTVSATLNATVNPNSSKVTDCKFEYGTSESYGSVAECATPPGNGSSPIPVSAALTGLSPNTTYHFRISATNGGGTSKGSDNHFTTLPNAPTVTTGSASAVAKTTATLGGTVNPNGGEVTACTLEYGATAAYGAAAPCSPAPGSGSSGVPVGAAVSGLSPNTTYHFRVSAANTGGSSSGADATFTTEAEPSSGGGGASGGGGGGATTEPVLTSGEIAAQLVPTGKGAKIKALLKKHGYALPFKSLGKGTIVISWFEVPKGAKLSKAKPKPILVASGRAAFSAAGKLTVTIKLTSAGNKLLKKVSKQKLTAQGVFTPPSGIAVKGSATFTLKR